MYHDANDLLGGTALSPPRHRIVKGAMTHDNMMTFDSSVIDSTGAFFIGELERLDQTLHMPLVEFSWGRDIDIRTDVSIADEISSWTNSDFAAMGNMGGQGSISWIGKDSNTIQGVSLDIGKTAQPLHLWGQEIKYTLPELESAMKLGRPVDAQKYEAMRLKYQMDIDTLVYNGDSTITATGLVNASNTVITNVANVANGGSGSPLWQNKAPDEILQDINELLTSVWNKAAYAVLPDRLLLAPGDYGLLVSRRIGEAASMSVLTYVLENNVVNRGGGGNLEIYPVKWLIGGGVSGTLGTVNGHNRMVAYRKEMRYIRYPMTPLQKTPLEYRSIFQMTTYFGRLGQMEFVYPVTVGYRDGMG